MKITHWRAPHWAPLWLRRAFPGRWTQAEIDDIWRRADERYERLKPFIEDAL